MARAKNQKKKANVTRAANAEAVRTLDPLRTGMPALDSIIDVKEFKKGKKTYRIIRTNEVDEYEQAPTEKKLKKNKRTKK